MITYLNNAWQLFDNYLLARWQNRPSTAAFWYLPEPSNLSSQEDLARYQASHTSPFYLIDYRQKLSYSLKNQAGIIVLPYQKPIGQQVNPEAAFQYALGLHDQFLQTQDEAALSQFKLYVDYFLPLQTSTGLWDYRFDWYGSTAPWHSALAQSRGAAVMLRAFKLYGEEKYLKSAKLALSQFLMPTSQGGFLHPFSRQACHYFEEYPHTPTGVINGFMSCLMNIWELNYWLAEPWLAELWHMGLHSLETMLPHYSTGWWSLYDLDEKTPVSNVNSPRYHLLEMTYLQILSLLSNSSCIAAEYQRRQQQYDYLPARMKALAWKSARKILYK